MATTVDDDAVASEGKGHDGRFQRPTGVETPGKRLAVNCLTAAIESFLAAREMSRAQLAEDICGTSESNFSKIVNGVQGDFWALVYKLPSDIRTYFYARLHESEQTDPVLVATEQLIHAAFRLLVISGAVPKGALRMVKASMRKSA